MYTSAKFGRKKPSSGEKQLMFAFVAEAKPVSADEQHRLKATQLFNHLFQACNILRGPINQDEFMAYVISILVLKRISDCYDVIIARSRVDPECLCSFNNYPRGQNQICGGVGGAAQQYFNVGAYNKGNVALPPLELQREFAAFIAQAEKASLKESLAALTAAQKALMNRALKDLKLTDMEGAMLRLREKRRQSFTVRGLFRYGWEVFKGEFVPGSNVCFEHEPDNKFDPNAVKVVLPRTRQMVGYVAKEYAREISCDLAEGWNYELRVVENQVVAQERSGQCRIEVVRKWKP